MKINELYIEQTNQFCEANCKITAEDILAKAKQRQAENVLAEITSKKTGKVITLPSGKKTMFRLSHVVAACLAIFLLTGTTILAFSGKIGQIFGDAGATIIAFDENKMEIFLRDIFGDKATAELAGQGYLYEINKTQEDENFRIDVLAASGDINNAKLVVDVYLKDEQLAAANDRIYLICYRVKSGEELVKDPNGCVVEGAYGVKDETVDNLYHVLLDIDSNRSNMDYYFTTVVTSFASDDARDFYAYDLFPDLPRDPLWEFHAMDIRFKISIPITTYSQIISRRYKEVSYLGPKYGYEYHLDKAEYSLYETRFTFYFDYEYDNFPTDDNGLYIHERFMSTEINSMLMDASLIVDGTEYKYDNENWNIMSHCYMGEGENNTNRGEFNVYFPAVDYFESNSILLRIGDETYDLKESK